MEQVKQLAKGVCDFIDKQIEFYSQCKYDFHENSECVDYLNGIIDGLRQVRTEIIREEALLKDE